MKHMFIKIKNLTDLSRFVLQAAKTDGDILVHRGRFCVDGKSIMGMFSIHISEGCQVEYPEDAIQFEKYIQQFKM